MYVKQLTLFEAFDKAKPKRSESIPAEGRCQGDYLGLEGDIPIDIPSNALVSLVRKPPLKIYSLGFQPAKSIPEIPRWCLQKYAGPSWVVLDPFAGSGTTIMEGLKFGASVYWLDYHPLSRLICAVKTNRYSIPEVLAESSHILREAARQLHAPTTIQFANKDFWFQKPVQEGLEILREQIAGSGEAVRPLLWLVLAATVRKCSNMNDGMLLAARRPHVEQIPQRSRADVFRHFRSCLDKALEAVVEWQSSIGSSLERAIELPLTDAHTLTGDWLCDAIITSPPYINAIDYVWAAKFELHWLGLVQNDQQRLELYTKEIGTERLPRSEYEMLGQTGHKRLDCLIEDVYTGKYYQASKGQNQLRARVLYQYFLDMKQHFASAKAHLKPGGLYCFSIGEQSRICGVQIPVAALLSDFASEVGLREKFRFHLLLKNRQLNVPRNVKWAGIIQHDTIIVLEKAAV